MARTLTETQERQLRRTLGRLGDQRGAIARHLRLPAPVTERDTREAHELLREQRSLYAASYRR
jgi:hypothetical protein